MSLHELKILATNDDGYPTETSELQHEVEEMVVKQFKTKQPVLHLSAHIQYLNQALNGELSRFFVVLDASKPWLVYWIIHSLAILGRPLEADLEQLAINTLSMCQHPDGGFGGGPGQLAHLATTYAAINALATIGTTSAYDIIDRKSLYSFLMRMKQPDGSFTVHDGGEIDIRGIYCALQVAQFCNIMTNELTINCGEFICRCQTWEGGLGPFPGVEAHGGYTFCGLAAMMILRKVHMLEIEILTTWIANRQMEIEGGFQGRTNKLVDGCYSFWQGGAMVLMEIISGTELFDKSRLQEYILKACQSKKGGLKDKPKKNQDFYHTCYVLSGFSTTQYTFGYENDCLVAKEAPILGGIGNRIKAVDPIHNVLMESAEAIKEHFRLSKKLI